MTAAGAAFLAGEFSLIAASWWILIRGLRRKPQKWGWIFAGLGLVLVSLSFLFFVILQYRLFKHPEIAVNTSALLIQVRSFTRFYPTSAGLFGGVLGLSGSGAVRWTILFAGALVGFLWSLFTISLL